MKKKISKEILELIKSDLEKSNQSSNRAKNRTNI